MAPTGYVIMLRDAFIAIYKIVTGWISPRYTVVVLEYQDKCTIIEEDEVLIMEPEEMFTSFMMVDENEYIPAGDGISMERATVLAEEVCHTHCNYTYIRV